MDSVRIFVKMANAVFICKWRNMFKNTGCFSNGESAGKEPVTEAEMKLDRPLFWVQAYQQDKLSGNEGWHKQSAQKDAKLLKLTSTNWCSMLEPKTRKSAMHFPTFFFFRSCCKKLCLLRKPLSVCGHKRNVRIWLRIRSACNNFRRKSGCFVFYGNKQRLGHPVLQNELRRV